MCDLNLCIILRDLCVLYIYVYTLQWNESFDSIIRLFLLMCIMCIMKQLTSPNDSFHYKAFVVNVVNACNHLL